MTTQMMPPPHLHADMNQKLSLGSLIWRSIKKSLSVVLWILSMYINRYLDLDTRAKLWYQNRGNISPFIWMRKVKEDMWRWGKNSLHFFDQESLLQENPWWWYPGLWFVDIRFVIYLYSGLSRSWKSSPMLRTQKRQLSWSHLKNYHN